RRGNGGPPRDERDGLRGQDRPSSRGAGPHLARPRAPRGGKVLPRHVRLRDTPSRPVPEGERVRPRDRSGGGSAREDRTGPARGGCLDLLATGATTGREFPDRLGTRSSCGGRTRAPLPPPGRSGGRVRDLEAAGLAVS